MASPRRRGPGSWPAVTFKYRLRSSVQCYLSELQAPTGDNLVSAGQDSTPAAAATMSTGSRSGDGSGKDEKDQGVSMGELLSRLKAIEEMMRPLVPLKDQVTALEASMVE
jgi:hypothetical protein